MSTGENITEICDNDTTMGPRTGIRREPCAVCGMPVFLAEKLMISRTPYHRTCFRCARCSNQLTPGNYYETEEGQYCCETCPDEEETKSASSPILHQAYNEAAVLNRDVESRKNLSFTTGYQMASLSDEEKTERILEKGIPLSTEPKVPSESLVADSISQSARMRLNFMTKNLLTERRDDESCDSSSGDEDDQSAAESAEIEEKAARRTDSSPPGGSFRNRRSPRGSPRRKKDGDGRVGAVETPFEVTDDRETIDVETDVDNDRSGASVTLAGKFERDDIDDRLDDRENDRIKGNFDAAGKEAADDCHSESRSAGNDGSTDRQDTKDSLGPDIDDVADTSKCLSIVQRRLRLFENSQLEEKISSLSTEKNFEKRMKNSLTVCADDKEIREGTRMIEKIDRPSMIEKIDRPSMIEKIDRPSMIEKIDRSSMIEKIDRSSTMEEIDRSSMIEKIDRSSTMEEIDRSSMIEDIDRSSMIEKIDRSSMIEKIDRSSMIEEEIDRSSMIEEEIDRSSMIEEKSFDDKSVTSITANESAMSSPPIAPKRTAPELRKAGKFKKRDSEITVLNATGIDLSAEENYPKDLNPFGSDDEEIVEECASDNLEISRTSKVSTNPFGSSDEDDDDGPKMVAPPRPAARNTAVGNKWRNETRDEIDEDAPTKRRLKAPQINLNPFWSDDDEDHESDDECGGHSLPSNTPVPKPRTIKQTTDTFLSQRKNDLHRGDIYASNSSLGSTGSASTPGGTYRKKKPAPPPPIVNELFASGADSMLSPNRGPNTFTGSNNSLRTTPRARKAKPAPPPPMPTSTPCSANLIANLTLTESPITDSGKIIDSRDYEMWDDRKIGKDEANRSKQSMTTISSDETNPYGGYTDKSVQGKWKRKKGPAPARPIPHRRKIKVMSLKDVKLELDEIEMQQQGLERQGVRLEQLIRDKAEAGNATEETSLEMDVEELVLELFALVNEKNELFRRQAELMLLRRQQRLEEEHADIEYQIRCLLCQPEATKTDFDKQREETLIQRLVDIVERRNEIVECLEMDRRREVEEDRSINTRMGLYAAKTKGDFARELEDDENNRSRKSKKTKLKEKAKEKILRKVHKKDADKDVDEAEVKLKRQNKKKWF